MWPVFVVEAGRGRTSRPKETPREYATSLVGPLILAPLSPADGIERGQPKILGSPYRRLELQRLDLSAPSPSLRGEARPDELLLL